MITGKLNQYLHSRRRNTVRCFQENVLAQHPWEKKRFQEADDWILKKNSDWLFSF